MEYCVYFKLFLSAHHYNFKLMFLVILNQHLISFLMTRAGLQPVTHMRSANSKPQPSNQFPTDTIKPRPHVFLFQLKAHES